MTTELVSTAEDVTGMIDVSNMPSEVQQRILAARQKIENSTQLAVRKITFSSTRYTLPDGTQTSSFSGFIVGVKHANVHYKTAFDPDNLQPPDCIAVRPINEDALCRDLTPASFVVAPYCSNCGQCQHFQFGSAIVGKGKACFEHTLLALYIPSLGEDLVILEQRKGNSKIADNYVKLATDRYTHPMAVLTKFTIGEKKEWVQTMEPVGTCASDLFANLANRLDEAEQLLYNRIANSYPKEEAEGGDIPFGDDAPAPVPTSSGRASRKKKA